MAGLALPGLPGSTGSMSALSRMGGSPYGGGYPNPLPPTGPYAPGPYGTVQTYRPSTINVSNDGMTVGHNTPGGWVTLPPPDFRTDEQKQLDQLAVESAREDVWAKKRQADYEYMTGVPGTTARTTTRSSSVGGGDGTGTAPSVSQIKNAITQLQPTLPPEIPTPDVPPAQVAPPSPADNAKATAAAYARAKDAITGEHTAATKALEGTMTGRGISGTGIEGKGRRDITRSSLAALGNVARGQAESDVARQDEFTKLGYSGNLQQRGQDINAILARYQAQLGQRGQNIGALPNPVSYIGPLTALALAGGSL